MAGTAEVTTKALLERVAKRQDDIDAWIKKQGHGASKAGVRPEELMSVGYVRHGEEHTWGTAAKRLAALSKAYNDDAAFTLMRKGADNKPLGIGWGPMLQAMAGVATGGKCGYHSTPEHLEKEWGAVPVSKYVSKIVGPDGQVRKTALAEGSGITGGYVVPPDFKNELLAIAGEDAFFEPRAKVMPMTTRTMQIPSLDITTNYGTGVSPYFGGIVASWQPEAATINETEPQFRQVELTAWDLVMYTVSSNQLLADNAIGLDALLTQLFGGAMTWYKEYAFLRGVGAGNSMPLGVINSPAAYVLNRTISGHFIMPDAANMMARLQVRSWDAACWVMHQSVLPELIMMNDNTGAQRSGNQNVGNFLAWLPPTGVNGAGPMAGKLPRVFLNGLPIFITEKLPQLGTKGDVMLLDLSHYVVGNRLEVQIDVSDQYLFRNNQLAWRVVARCDGRPWLNNVITDASGWTMSPFVILN